MIFYYEKKIVIFFFFFGITKFIYVQNGPLLECII